jgi:hypothetical protein
MNLEEIIRYVLSFFGGGLLAAVGNWVHSTISSQRQREVDHSKNQLELLYGPLFFFTKQNEKLFSLCQQIDEAYTNEFVTKKWSSNETTQASVRKDADMTNKLKKEYHGRIIANDARIMDILEKGWHLIDTDDADELAQFQVDYIRYITECDEKLKIPFSIYKRLGDIPNMRQSMSERVKLQTHIKQSRLRELTRSCWKCCV